MLSLSLMVGVPPIGQFVVGVDADFDWANIKWSQSVTFPVGGLFGGPGGNISASISDKDQFLSTFGARFGYAFDHAMIYAKAGGAWEREQFNLSVTNVAGAVATATGNTNRLGWMVGAGLEYAVTNNVTLKAEYNYVNFGTYNQTITLAGGGLAGATGTFNTKQNISLVKVGASYLFNSY
jgi:outer membrane immunogenic protein